MYKDQKWIKRSVKRDLNSSIPELTMVGWEGPILDEEKTVG